MSALWETGLGSSIIIILGIAAVYVSLRKAK